MLIEIRFATAKVTFHVEEVEEFQIKHGTYRG